MRLLFAIPHYFAATAGTPHGSLGGDRQRRLACLTACIERLHETFGGWQRMADSRHPRGGAPANQELRHEIEVVVCTTGDDHLAAALPAGLCRHHATRAAPRLLGYECHAVLRDGLAGGYDWYGYLEDDLLLGDPLFLAKLDWFRELAGARALLLPNRFERAAGRKLYVDGALARSLPPIAQPEGAAGIHGRLLGRDFAFARVDNPHAGCFFLTRDQMQAFAAAPWFLDRAADFWGPLESAATLGILRSFAVYKPARRNAGFLEIHHADNRLLGRA